MQRHLMNCSVLPLDAPIELAPLIVPESRHDLARLGEQFDRALETFSDKIRRLDPSESADFTAERPKQPAAGGRLSRQPSAVCDAEIEQLYEYVRGAPPQPPPPPPPPLHSLPSRVGALSPQLRTASQVFSNLHTHTR